MTADPSGAATPAATGVAILIPAAGASSRMRGRDKLVEPVRGRPLLADRVAAAAEALAGDAATVGDAGARPAGPRIVVTLPPPDRAPARWTALEGLVARKGVTDGGHGGGGHRGAEQAAAGVPDLSAPGALVSVEVPDPAPGLSASLRAGLAVLPAGCAGVMILPADMPDITAADIRALLDGFDGETILRGASHDGRPGHPVLFPARDLAALARVTGDQGGRAVLAAAADRIRLVPLPGDHALTDLDTPEDWARWRHAN